MKYKIYSVVLIVVALSLAFFIFQTQKPDSRFPFRLGLDLRGGSHLVFNADTIGLSRQEIEESMASLREVIERRVNIFGVSEPIVQLEKTGFSGEENRLIVELPGVTDLEKAVELIGRTPLLEFRLEKEGTKDLISNGEEVSTEELFEETGLSGRLLNKSHLEFDRVTGEPIIALSFNKDGKELFAQITRENTGKVLAIFLDGELLSTPVIREEIPNGTAQISGNFTPEEARELVRDLNLGALPIPIELVSTQSVGAYLGEKIFDQGLKAAIYGLILVAIFLVFWYRLSGFLALIALSIYILIMLSLFKLIPVTITAAGIAGFILSVGMAVDANVLIFERMKEEIKQGKPLLESVKTGFKRAWFSIRDSNLSSLLMAVILFFVATSLVKGFALIFALGILVSMFSAIVVTRTFLLAVVPKGGNQDNAILRFLLGTGIKK